MTNPGDALRDEVRRLLSYRHKDVRLEARLNGKKADLVYETRSLGKNQKIIVEAKDYAKALTRQHVVNIWADYGGVVARHSPSLLLIVTRNGLTTDAREFVEENESIRHQTLLEVYQESVGLSEYTAQLSQAYEALPVSNYYIRPRLIPITYVRERSTRSTQSPVDAMDYISHWVDIEQQTRPIAILGGYGAGKTTLAMALANMLASKLESNQIGRIPVIINLGKLSRYSSLEGLLGAMFTYEFPTESFSFRRFSQLNEEGALLIILDGFDEMKHAMTWPEFRDQILELNRLINPRSKIILSGRPSAFLSIDEHHHVIRGLRRYKESWIDIEGWPKFHEMELDEFSAAERSSFVERYISSRCRDFPRQTVTDRIDEVNRITELDHNIFARPVHLQIICEVASNLTLDLGAIRDGVSLWDLYDLFVGALARRESEKDSRRRISDDQRIAFLANLAWWLWLERSSSTSFRYDDVPPGLFGDDELSELDEAARRREYLSGFLLEKKSGDNYYFSHRSFAEFLVAKKIVSYLDSSIGHAELSTAVDHSVAAFVIESGQTDPIKKSIKQLETVRGSLPFSYLYFLVTCSGGLGHLRQTLNPDCSLAHALLAFDHKQSLELDESVVDKAMEKMSSAGTLRFFALYNVVAGYYEAKGSITQEEKAALAYEICALLFERVFSRVFRRSSVKLRWSIESDSHEELILLTRFTEVRRFNSGRFVQFRWREFTTAASTTLQEQGFEILFSAVDGKSVLDPVNVSLPFDEVMSLLAADQQRTVRDFVSLFQSFEDIDIVTRTDYLG